MRILAFGDVVGRSGRRSLCESLPHLRRELAVDFVIVNGENAAGGFGITPKICDQFFAAGADVVTTGNHAWDQKEIVPHFDMERRLLRPHNYPEGTPGTGAGSYEDNDGRKVIVLHFMGLLFMPSLDDPFTGIDRALLNTQMGGEIAAIRSDSWRTWDFMWGAHIIDYRDRDNIDNFLLKVLSILALISALSGIALFFKTFKRI